MSDDLLALSGLSGLPHEAEYDAAYATVTATERGRWFLAEYASRNRHADTDLVIAAIARMEAAIGARAPGSGAPHKPDIDAAVERLADVAVELRERGADAALCDTLDAAIREIWGSTETTSGAKNGTRNGVAPAENAPRASNGAGNGALMPHAASGHLPDSETFAEAAAALAASFSSLPGGTEPDHGRPGSAGEPEAGPETPSAESADVAQGSFIEGPDFVFDGPRPGSNGHDSMPVCTYGQARELLPGPEFIAGSGNDSAGPFEPDPGPVDMPLDGAAAPGEGAVSVAPPIEFEITAAAEPAAPAAPQLLPATAPAVRALRQPSPPAEPLVALRALSEEELIALFG